jgi:hypothetical protein
VRKAIWLPSVDSAKAVAAERRRERSRDRGNAVHDQRWRRRDERFLGERVLENNQSCSKQEDSANFGGEGGT